MNRASLIFFLVLHFTATYSKSAKDYTQKGREFYEKLEFMEALLKLNKAPEIDSNYAAAYLQRGNIKDNFDDRHGAMKDYNVALEKSPKFADAYLAGAM